jgi:alpha-glucosidase
MSEDAATRDATDPWWRRAVVYQVYIRSFADGDGDGIGDIAGIRSRLRYLADLGVDALWITPWYPSPMADGGYDVADYRAIDPRFGTLADAESLVREAHALGLRVLIDLVPNHTSSAHAWFREALGAAAGSAARERYVFRDGRGADGATPPNGWESIFGGGAWERVTEPDGRPGQWYLHLFDVEQPDLNWDSDEVRASFEAILRFWFELGLDGFRIDVASAMVKDYADPADVPSYATDSSPFTREMPFNDREGVHDIHRAWRRVADGVVPPRVLLGEVHAIGSHRLARYLRPDELHGAFNFPFMRTAWSAPELRDVVDDTIAAHRSVGASPTWVWSNHDEARLVTRLGRPVTAIRGRPLDEPQPSDLELGTRRARAAALLLLALPGGAYVYQGEELGLWEVTDLPPEVLEDPIWERTGHAIRGRDGCRVPLPWSGDAPPFGFGPEGSVPWLPQPAAWRSLTASAEAADPASMLSLYRAALEIRRSSPGLAGESLRWVEAPAGVLAFEREAGFRCVVNISEAQVALPAGFDVLLRSDHGAAADDPLPPDAAAWLREATRP